MTRINIIEPKELSDQHLVAEYREIFMIGSALQRSLKSPKWNETKETLPEDFTLNAGHIKFFFNKGEYLHNRYLELIEEMKMRGMKPDPDRKFKREQWPDDLYKNWKPNDKDFKIIKKRIQERIDLKPEWYRYSERIYNEF